MDHTRGYKGKVLAMDSHDQAIKHCNAMADTQPMYNIEWYNGEMDERNGEVGIKRAFTDNDSVDLNATHPKIFDFLLLDRVLSNVWANLFMCIFTIINKKHSFRKPTRLAS